jgi:hypothetical protein
MSLLIRLILAAGGGVAALFLSREAAGFPIAQAMFGIITACLVLVLLAFGPRLLSGARRDKR